MLTPEVIEKLKPGGQILALSQYADANTFAKLWDIDRSTVQRRLKAWGVVPVRFGRSVRYLIADVERALREHGVPPRGRRPLI